MNKKIFALLIAVITALTLSGCGLVVVEGHDPSKKENSRRSDRSNTSGGYGDDLPDISPNGEFIMPSLIGMTWEEAFEKYSSIMNLVPQQEYNDAEKDTIFDQDPPASRSAKLNQTVNVRVSAGRRKVEIYDFKNRPMTYAEYQLKRDGFKVSVVYQSSDTVEKDYVIETDPPAHTMAEQGSEVVLIVSSGQSDRSVVEIYDFTNRPMTYAEDQLKRDGFNVSVVYQSSDTIAKDCVIETDPPAHTMAEQGSEVFIIVSTGQSDSSVEMPTITARLNITIPAGVTGEFELRYYVDGKIVSLPEPDIRDLSLSSNRSIPYELEGTADETEKDFALKVVSRATGKEGWYIEYTVDFSQDPPKATRVMLNPSIFSELQ